MLAPDVVMSVHNESAVSHRESASLCLMIMWPTATQVVTTSHRVEEIRYM